MTKISFFSCFLTSCDKTHRCKELQEDFEKENLKPTSNISRGMFPNSNLGNIAQSYKKVIGPQFGQMQ